MILNNRTTNRTSSDIDEVVPLVVRLPKDTDSNGLMPPTGQGDTDIHTYTRARDFAIGDRVIIKNLPAFLAKYRGRSLEVQTGTHEVVAVKGDLITTLFAGKRYKLNSGWLAVLP